MTKMAAAIKFSAEEYHEIMALKEKFRYPSARATVMAAVHGHGVQMTEIEKKVDLLLKLVQLKRSV